MRRILVPAVVLVGLASPLAGASTIGPATARHATARTARGHRPAAASARGLVPLWLAGTVSYKWSGNECATPSAPSPGAPATAPCHETFTNVVAASVSSRSGRLLAPPAGETVRFAWFGDTLTPTQPGQTRCTIVDAGVGTETVSADGASSTVRYTSYSLSSPDCTLDTTNGPPPSKSLEATGSCLSCGFSGYLGQPIRIYVSAPGYRVLDNAFPANTNTI